MSTPRSAATGGSARKAAARNLAQRTGMKYTAALALVAEPATPPPLRGRWVLTDEVHAFVRGKGWHGLYYGDLYRELDERPTAYDCDWCGDPGDAADEDSSVEFVVIAYDPDLAPQTHIVAVKPSHARCKPSRVSWVVRADIPDSPTPIGLPSSARPDMVGEFEISAHTLLMPPWEDDERDDASEPTPVLLLTASVSVDHDQGDVAWLNELQFFLNANGFAHPDAVLDDSDPPQWTVRIVSQERSGTLTQWLAVRTAPVQVGAEPQHFFLGRLDLPLEWIAAARSAARVVVCVGPCTLYGQVPDIEVDGIDPEALDELLDDGTLILREIPVVDEDRPDPASSGSGIATAAGGAR